MAVLTEAFYAPRRKQVAKMRVLTELEHYGLPTLIAEDFYASCYNKIMEKILSVYPDGVHMVDMGYSFLSPTEVLIIPVKLSEIRYGRWG